MFMNMLLLFCLFMTMFIIIILWIEYIFGPLSISKFWTDLVLHFSKYVNLIILIKFC